jgi:hypothetical protein
VECSSKVIEFSSYCPGAEVPCAAKRQRARDAHRLEGAKLAVLVAAGVIGVRLNLVLSRKGLGDCLWHGRYRSGSTLAA